MKLQEFLRIETSQFSHYQSAEVPKHSWRVLVFSCDQEELKQIALVELQRGLGIECKISRNPWKTSLLFNSTFFFQTLGEALQFRSRWYENSNSSTAGPIPLALIESQHLKEESQQQALSEMMAVLDGMTLNVGAHGSQVTLKTSKGS